MLEQLEAATRAYRDAQTAVLAAEQHLADRKAEVPYAREELAAAIVAAARAGVRQVDIVKITGYGREQVRRICRAGGVEPAD